MSAQPTYYAEVLTKGEGSLLLGDYRLQVDAESALRKALGSTAIFVQPVSTHQWVVVDSPSGLVTGLITKRD